MTATIASTTKILKEYYHGQRVESLMYKTNPFWGLLAKSEKFYGKNIPIPVTYGGGNGRSRTFATAQANRSGSKHEAFALTRAKDYSIWSIDNEAMEAAQSDKGAFARTVLAETKGAYNKIEQSISRSLFRNHGGSIGVIESGAGTTTLVLTNKADIVNFEVGDIIVHAATDGTSGALGAGAATTITAVNRSAKSITAAANWPAAFTAGQFLFHSGDFGLALAGLDSWLPAAAPGSTAFFGVDRSVDVDRLGGVRYVATPAEDGTLQKALVNTSSDLMTNGGTPDLVVMNPLDYTTLLNDIGTKTRFEKMANRSGAVGGKAVLSYSALCIMLGTGEAKIISDKHCPRGVAYMLQMGTWKLWSLGKCPRMFDADGNKLLREDAADALQGRIFMYGNLGCSAPGYNARVDISAFA
ncbi:MAG: phage major capsid protein [Mycobacterium sp.]